jgi:hypothetical protein
VWHRNIQPIRRAAAIALLLLPMLLTGRALITGGVYAPVDLAYATEPLNDYARDYGIGKAHNGLLTDLYSQIHPWRAAVRNACAHQQWPLLNPFMMGGDILAASAQPAPYDPLNVASLLIPLPDAITFAAAMTLFLAAFFTFAYVHRTGGTEIGALVAAAGYVLCEQIAFYAGWPIGRAWSLFPFVLVAVVLAVRDRDRRAAVVLTAACATTILAGHPETLLHVMVFAGVLAVFEIAALRDLHAIGRAIGLGVLSTVLALLICAVFLMPFLDAMRQTNDYQSRVAWAETPHRFDADAARNRLAETFIPFWAGLPWKGFAAADWELGSARVGNVVVAFAVIALVIARRRRGKWFWFGTFIVTFLAGLDAPPVAPLLHELPLFSIALNDRLVFVAAFALAVLASMGVDELIERPRRRTAIIPAVVAIALAIAFAFAWRHGVRAGVPRQMMIVLIVVELVPLVIVAILIMKGAPARIVALSALTFVLGQRVIEDGNIYPVAPRASFYPRIPVIDAIPRSEEPFRIVSPHFGFVPNTAAFYGLEDIRGYQAMSFGPLLATYPQWCEREGIWFNRVDNLTRPFLSLANVRYAITTNEEAIPEGWRLLKADRRSRLLENTRALPRAFVPRRIRYEKSDDAILLGMRQTTDFGDVGFLKVPHYLPHEIVNGRGTLRTRYHGLSLIIDANMAGDAWIVVSQAGWRGWRAYIDERRVEIFPANQAFLGIFIPRGRHSIRMVFQPRSFTTGRNITFGTLTLIALTFVYGGLRRGRSRGPLRRHSVVAEERERLVHPGSKAGE